MSSLYKVINESVSTVKKFNTQKRRVVFKVKQSSDSQDLLVFFKTAIEQIIAYAMSNVSPTDRVGITFEFDSFKDKLPGYMSFRPASEVTYKDVWGILESILQSDPEALSTDKFRMIVSSVTPPAGQGRARSRVGFYSTFAEECSKRRGIVSIKNNDNLCLPRALVVGRAHADNNVDYKKIRQNQTVQKIKAEEMMQEAGVSFIPPEGAGVNELRLFQQYLTNYKITVYSYSTKGRDVIFEGADDAEKNINLLYHEHHYNVITSLTSAFVCSYFCEHCHVPYNNKRDHRCEKSCVGCGSSPPCERTAQLISCPDCRRDFRSQACFNNHQEGNMCLEVKKCEGCFKTINIKTRKQAHVCGEIYCKICQSHKPENHFCHIQPAKPRNTKQDTLFVFFDLETRQEKEIAPGVNLHEPNLCVFQQVCSECYNDSSSTATTCVRCGLREQILRGKCIDGFLAHLLEMRKKFKKVVAVAHNGQAFDTQFILNYLITNNTSLKPDLIMRGSKILLLQVDNLKIIDSLNFFPMALADLPKAFDLPAPKGYFPHLFNTEANAHYVGPLPDIKFYSPDTMKPQAREVFLKWYEANRYTEFDMQRDLVEYCRTDVDILKRACIHFRNLFIEECDVDPFTEAITIASACNLMFRRKFLKESTIGLIPKGGYRLADNQSRVALQWLLLEEHQRGVEIQHVGRQREAIVGGLKVDGLYGNTIFQFHGCYFHGCPTCFTTRRNEPLHDDPSDTMDMRLEKTRATTEKLKSLGYEVVEQWECRFRRQLTPEFRQQVEKHPLLVNTPLNPREAFYGGRTGAAKLKRVAKDGEKIRYVDVCSLYPWVCKYGKFPVGHPEVYVGKAACENLIRDKGGLENINGVVKCTVLPPQDLYHPVLPVKMHQKLLFPLCRTCAEEMNQAECQHGVEDRVINGTWVLDELVMAIRKGYIVQDIQEIWSYDVTQYNKASKSGGLFSGFIDKFLKMKQEASGWPSSITTNNSEDGIDGARKQYVDDYFENEGVSLDSLKIVKNPGLRSLAKLMLNSFWGKFGQRENQPKTSIINEPKEFFDLLSNPSVEVNNVQEINDEVIAVNWQHKEEAADLLSSVNVVIAAFVTAQARLKLYSYLDQLGERVLYYDTDSVIYASKPGDFDLPTGSFLGDLTDELEEYGPGSYIIEFVSGGPKNYAYKVYSPTTGQIHVVVKVKGITLNHAATQKINFESMLRLLEGMDEKIIVESNNIRRTADHHLVTRTESKAYRITFTKRRRIEDFDSVPFGYNSKRPRV